MSDGFEQRNETMVRRMARDRQLDELTRAWVDHASRFEYSYHFTWLGRPIIQLPQDIVAMQEIIWRVKPDLIIETGIARGGSLILHASLLELLGGARHVVGVDVDIRPHNRMEIERHPLAHRIRMIEGSSTDPGVVAQVEPFVRSANVVLAALDSNHTHDHVLRELQLYSPWVTPGSYLVVFDTVVERMPEDFFPDRPWRQGNNPWTAVREFLDSSDRFEVDHAMCDKLQITAAPGGYLRCIR